MTRGKQKIEAQKKNAERNQKSKGSQLEARAAALKTVCPVCKIGWSMVSDATLVEIYLLKLWEMEMITHMPMREIVKEIMKAQLANYNQLIDHYSSKHPKESVPAPPAGSS